MKTVGYNYLLYDNLRSNFQNKSDLTLSFMSPAPALTDSHFYIDTIDILKSACNTLANTDINNKYLTFFSYLNWNNVFQTLEHLF